MVPKVLPAHVPLCSLMTTTNIEKWLFCLYNIDTMKGLEGAANDLHKVRLRIARLRDSGRLSEREARNMLVKVFDLLEDLEKEDNDVKVEANVR